MISTHLNGISTNCTGLCTTYTKACIRVNRQSLVDFIFQTFLLFFHWQLHIDRSLKCFVYISPSIHRKTAIEKVGKKRRERTKKKIENIEHEMKTQENNNKEHGKFYTK